MSRLRLRSPNAHRNSQDFGNLSKQIESNIDPDPQPMLDPGSLETPTNSKPLILITPYKTIENFWHISINPSKAMNPEPSTQP